MVRGQKSGDEDEKQGSPWENLATSLRVRWEDVQMGWMFPSMMVFKPIQSYFPGAVYTLGRKELSHQIPEHSGLKLLS